jgi:hypothetical protein
MDNESINRIPSAIGSLVPEAEASLEIFSQDCFVTLPLHEYNDLLKRAHAMESLVAISKFVKYDSDVSTALAALAYECGLDEKTASGEEDA